MYVCVLWLHVCVYMHIYTCLTYVSSHVHTCICVLDICVCVRACVRVCACAWSSPYESYQVFTHGGQPCSVALDAPVSSRAVHLSPVAMSLNKNTAHTEVEILLR